jgi:hypothetical protein
VDVATFDTILLFACVTGRGATLSDVSECLSLFINLVETLQPRQKVVSTGSASVYVNTKVLIVIVLNTLSTLLIDTLPPQSLELYDFCTSTMDQIALLSGRNVYGLRLGSVCGDLPTWRKGHIIARS